MDYYNDDDLKNEGEPEQGPGTRQSLGKNQKVAVAVLGVLAVVVIIMWMAQLKESLNGPFSYNLAEAPGSTATCEGPDCQESLKTMDTDGDRLTDWDELNVYETSPYLEDSDSDGISDKEEIGTGTDPNCPAGRDCSTLIDTSPAAGTAEEEPVSGQAIPDLNTGATLDVPASVQEEDLQKMLEGQSDASALRKMLLESGMDQETLNEISDADLMASYQEILQSQ
ncbi:MAG: thrombospondin type 3 repeat-containing protein [Patescibacteria group bacterium]|nr:thrombospondin type 3 repeat-containing protein [Patescibacteria group bacterium]MDD5294975.1 thrombospondin type 3 repeat-containing protein [Patescibacteria group bacterium]MDD5554508.1 thrombospondin type 3 repeat-containing protein [Patescibacteria group bacterium]